MKKLFSVLLSAGILLSAAPVSAATALQLGISSDDKSIEISDNLYGTFIEDISYACDGGLVSNLVNNNSFEYEFNPTSAWIADDLDLAADTESPMRENNPTYGKVTVDGKGLLTNTGYTEMYDYKSYDRDEKKAKTPDMGFTKDVAYDFSCYIKNIDFSGEVIVYLDSSKNKQNTVSIDMSTYGNTWRKANAVLTAAATEDGGLTIELNGKGTICIDFVMLVPQNSYGYNSEEWKYTTLRTDLFEAHKNMNPSFVRFPGGCLAEGDSLENLYDWKETIGPLEERTQTYNLWRDDVGRDYINTNSMGYHEFFQLCDDIDAAAIPILNAGLICQGRAGYDDHVIALERLAMTDDEWETFLTETRGYDESDTEGRAWFTDHIESMNINSENDFQAYLDTIALRPGTAQWDNYVQDILDLIEYANGDSQTSYWGALRFANGQEEPFDLKYLGIGNENWGEIYERNFKALYEAVKKAYPEITIISSSGTWLDGEAYEYNWDWINENYPDTIVDEHYYTGDGYLFDNNNRYDSFDRNGAHVFVGEYAATAKGVGTIQTKSNMLEAVEEASYLTGIERNGDLVEMTAYAPTFAKVNAQCWNINLIWFDSQETVLTPSYYVQMLFANNYGTTYSKSAFGNGETIQDGVYESVTVDKENEVLYIKLVNTSGKKKNVNVSLDGYTANEISVQSISANYKSACNEIGKNATFPTQYSIEANKEFGVQLGKYDVSVVRVAYGNNSGTDLFALPEHVGVATKTTTYLPAIIKIAVPCAIAGVVVLAIGVFTVVMIIRKKKNKTA